MEENNWSLYGVFALVVLAFVITGGFCYRVGRGMERAALTDALTKQIESIYGQGFDDGYRKAMKDLDEAVDTEGLNWSRR